MWEDKADYLEIIARYFNVYATIGSTKHRRVLHDWSIVPSFVKNMGILNGTDLHQLLQVCNRCLFDLPAIHVDCVDIL